MLYEVEMKARIDDAPRVEESVAALCRFERDFVKMDLYYHVPGDPEATSFRLRTGNGSAVVTLKEKRMQGSAEVNEEREFTVSDPAEFHRLVTRLCAEEVIRKEKRGRAYRYGELTVEICDVTDLGRFVEVEALVDSPEKAGDAIGKIAELFRRVGVTEDMICRRYYVDMLMERGKRAPTDA
jgi:adenylate cyclase class 2